MMSVTTLAQHLLRLDPQKNVGRLSFYHFLKNFCDVNTVLSAELINDFFARALSFQYWQTHQAALGQVVQHDLENYVQSTKADLDLTPVKFAHELQIIRLQHFSDCQEVVNRSLELELRKGEKLRHLKLNDQQLLVFILKPSGALQVRVYGNTALIRSGGLHPLAPHAQLHYNPQLELEPDKVQIFESSMMTTARFRMTDDGCIGHLLRGYTFQKTDTLRGGSLIETPDVFYALKKLERHFVNPQTDPFYQELVSILEKAYQLLDQGHNEGEQMGRAALQRGKMALKNIFPNDKLLLLLVTNIDWMLSRGKVPAQNSSNPSSAAEEPCPKSRPLPL